MALQSGRQVWVKLPRMSKAIQGHIVAEVFLGQTVRPVYSVWLPNQGINYVEGQYITPVDCAHKNDY